MAIPTLSFEGVLASVEWWGRCLLLTFAGAKRKSSVSSLTQPIGPVGTSFDWTAIGRAAFGGDGLTTIDPARSLGAASLRAIGLALRTKLDVQHAARSCSAPKGPRKRTEGAKPGGASPMEGACPRHYGCVKQGSLCQCDALSLM